MNRVMPTIAAAFALAAVSLNAAEVTSDDAKSAVTGFVNQRAALGEAITASPSGVQAYAGADGVGKYYVVSLTGGGYVVTSGDTSLKPIMAYSKRGTWDASEANPAVTLLSGDAAALAKALAAESSAIKTEANEAEWAKLIAAADASRSRLLSASTSDLSEVRVAPLLTSRWAQGDVTGASTDTLHCYNYYTPNHYVCGCTATAMAQLMYYHKYPTEAVTAKHNYYDTVYFSTDSDDKEGWNISEGYCTSKGATKTAWSPAFGGPYDWDNMIDIPEGNATTANCQAIGQLTRDAGLTVFSGYNLNGGGETSGYSGTDASALIDTFGYADAVRTGYSETAVLASLDAKLPVLFGLSRSGGSHAVRLPDSWP